MKLLSVRVVIWKLLIIEHVDLTFITPCDQAIDHIDGDY
jgi:hypothetical protein